MPLKWIGLCTLGLMMMTALPQPVLAAAGGDASALITRLVVWIYEQQSAFHRELTQGLQSLTAGGGMTAGAGLIGASFIYGIFHAAGPGHGKAILTTYLLTHKQHLARGLWLAVAAAFCQGLTAIAIVYGLIVVAGWLPKETTSAVLWSERLSYSMVFLIGAYLAFRAVRSLYGLAKPHIVPQTVDVLDHHHHGDEGGCGHSHGPSADQIADTGDIRTSIGLILSIGLRPCSGAVLVLVFARIAHLSWAGIASVAAMSMGTAIAVSSLAFLAVHARKWAESVGGGTTARRRIIGNLVALSGGLLVMVIGFSLVSASFGPTHPLGLS